MKIGPLDLDIKSMLAIAGGIALMVGTFMFGRWTQTPTIEELTERANTAAENARIKTIEYQNLQGEMQKAVQKLTFNYTSEHQLRQALEERNAGLARQLNETNATLTRIAQANAELRETLEGMDPIAVTDSTIVVEIDKKNIYDRGSIGVEGTVSINRARLDSAETNLDVNVRTSPLLVWQRHDDGTSSITLDYGDMPVTVDSLFGMENVNDPIHDQSRSPFPQLFGTSILVVGGLVAAGVAVSALFF